jgi:hypothetical protein
MLQNESYFLIMHLIHFMYLVVIATDVLLHWFHPGAEKRKEAQKQIHITDFLKK